jgi:hypothetical protein
MSLIRIGLQFVQFIFTQFCQAFSSVFSFFFGTVNYISLLLLKWCGAI